ncbi:MAG: CoA pyrophosphatase [Alphaproteobacteria bacterium]
MGARERGDYDLNPGYRPTGELTPAAVLVPLIAHEEGLSVLLTQRTDHLHDHAGQVSFPGGRVDEGDGDALAAALRETEEEVGIKPEGVDIVGRLDDYVTGTGYLVTPIVGLLTPPIETEADPFEVADIFEVPLEFLLDPVNRGRKSLVWKGVERHFYAMEYGERYIWGATAGMLVNLSDILEA